MIVIVLVVFAAVAEKLKGGVSVFGVFFFFREAETFETAISGSFTTARLPSANDTGQQMDGWIAWKDFKHVGTAHIFICSKLDRPSVSTLLLILFHLMALALFK